MQMLVTKDMTAAGVRYKAGDLFNVLGVQHRQFFGDSLMPITDPDLIKAARLGQNWYTVVAPFRWARHDYAAGDLMRVEERSMLRRLPKTEDGQSSVRPATGDEVVAWYRRIQATGALPEDTGARDAGFDATGEDDDEDDAGPPLVASGRIDAETQPGEPDDDEDDDEDDDDEDEDDGGTVTQPPPPAPAGRSRGRRGRH
jgi:hypothetical protein